MLDLVLLDGNACEMRDASDGCGIDGHDGFLVLGSDTAKGAIVGDQSVSQ
jgi:hypothetical protein